MSTIENRQNFKSRFQGKHSDLTEKIIGVFYAVMLELKAVRKLIRDHDAQLLNFLTATEIEVGVVLNFGPKAEFVRRILDNERKGSLSWVSSLL